MGIVERSHVATTVAMSALLVAGCANEYVFSERTDETLFDDSGIFPAAEDWAETPDAPGSMSTEGAEVVGDTLFVEPQTMTDPPWFGQGAAADLLDQHLVAAGAFGPTAAAAYESSLSALRSNILDVGPALQASYASANPLDYTRRWTVVQIAADLRDSSLRSFLYQVATDPISAALPDFEGSGDTGDGCGYVRSDYEEEAQIRNVAVLGLSLLVSTDQAASTALESVALNATLPHWLRKNAILFLRANGVDVGGLSTPPELDVYKTVAYVTTPPLLTTLD